MCGCCIPESELEKGICPACKGKRTATVKGKKQPCKACKGTGIRVDEIY